MELNRPITQQEEKLLELLIEKSTKVISKEWKTDLKVSPMDDGGMGGFYLYPSNSKNEHRKFGKQVSEYIFKDIDGVDVIASLNLDEEGNLFELELWKVNFEKLLKFPDSL